MDVTFRDESNKTSSIMIDYSDATVPRLIIYYNIIVVEMVL